VGWDFWTGFGEMAGATDLSGEVGGGVFEGAIA